MEPFQFSKNFLTGLKDVDDQHRRLVAMINTLGESITAVADDTRDFEPLFQALTDYAQYHFEDEKKLMQDMNVDMRHYDRHIKEHRNFLRDVTDMHADTASDRKNLLRKLFTFLTHWLAYHILGCDKKMAKQIKAIKSGMTPSKVFEQMEKTQDSSTEPLLLAINGLFQLVSDRNKELKKLNRSLELKVKDRTRELYKANKHLVEIAVTDALTKLPNRRYAISQLKKFWEESIQTQKPLSVMMIDADHFKEINDTYGHDAGDSVLFELARTLQHSVRTDDVVCRLGGDEFLVICPGTGKKGGRHVAEIVWKNVSKMRVSAGDGCWNGSVSIGVSSRKDGMNNFEALIKAADEAVYAAKRAGKNCVRLADEIAVC